MIAVPNQWSDRLRWSVALLTLSCLPLLFAQSNAKITQVEPASGKVDAAVTLTGENLGKDNVLAIFLSDANDDFKATVVEQADSKIVMKVPTTKAGAYNIAMQVKDRILILPLKFSVTE